ncbi:MAG: RCC1 repeat-containing protein [Actinomycetota bacterium]|nr:RCC1 repeat-containing protein [Actinomycetota bacterium]
MTLRSSEPDEPIGQGRTYSYSSAGGDVFKTQGGPTGINLFVEGSKGDFWSIGLEPPKQRVLTPATYVRAVHGGPPTVPDLVVFGLGRACGGVTGTFKVLGIAFRADHTLEGLHATFEQHCQDGAPALRGEIQVGSPPPDTPEPLPEVPVVPDTTATPAVLNMVSDPGDWVGKGRKYAYSARNLDYFTWRAERGIVAIELEGSDGVRWDLDFNGPMNRLPVPGDYRGATNDLSPGPTEPGLSVAGHASGCNVSSGHFRVIRADYQEDGTLERFHATFENHCEHDSAALRGEIAVGISDPPLSIDFDDPARAWGYNGQGQLGDGTTSTRSRMVGVAGNGDFTEVSTGGLHSLGLKDDGTVWAWGWNAYGQLGDGTTVDRATPTRVHGLRDVTSISAGFVHSLAVKNDGTVWAWGWNALGQVGDGTTDDRFAPVRVFGLDDVASVSAGLAHNLGLKKNGTVWAWGWNAYGQVGDGTTVDRATPVRTRGLNYVRQVAAGGLHSLALNFVGQMSAWGSNVLNQLGDRSTQDRHLPVSVHYGYDISQISAGLLHSLALRREVLHAWGWNGLGQLGDGTTTDRNFPWPVPGMSRVNDISAGCYHSVALKDDGNVRAWGSNVVGQLGDSTTVDKRAPIQTSGAAPTVRVSAGCLHSLGLHRTSAG